jgi:hypothetical protein
MKRRPRERKNRWLWSERYREFPTESELKHADHCARLILCERLSTAPRRFKSFVLNAILYLIDRDAYTPQKRRLPKPWDSWPWE